MVQFLILLLSLFQQASLRSLQGGNCFGSNCYKAGQAGARTYNPDILSESEKCMSTCLNSNRGVC